MPVFVRFRSGDFVVGKIQFTGLFWMIKKSTYKILGACRITISLRFTILLRHRAFRSKSSPAEKAGCGFSAAITCPGLVQVWHFTGPSRVLAISICAPIDAGLGRYFIFFMWPEPCLDRMVQTIYSMKTFLPKRFPSFNNVTKYIPAG